MYPKIVKWGVIILTLVLALALSSVISLAFGPVNIPLDEIFAVLINGEAELVNKTIISHIRLPRIILAMLVGSALAVAGAAMQGLFKNPMADPYVIGISSGAAFGASIAIIAGISVPILAFLGALGAVFLVYNIAIKNGKIAVETLLLSGIAIAAFFSATTSLLMYMAGENLHQIVFWLMGGLWASDWDKVMVAFPPILLGIIGISIFSRDLNAMLLGEEPAQYLGIDVENVKRILLVLASLITGIAVSVSGIIGFVGLIIPHMVRIVVGPDNRILIPSCGLVGAIFLIWADVLARTIIAPTELPVGIIMALFGVPFFIYLLRSKKRNWMIRC
ncbi:MAG: iron chelate uptake ABC transporter family permease subunit [Candidatus Altiarchaeales archaeon]|nr:iron chelate uptake ABC transporter family permease subunit [Candidatus Altiarchaeota archaeon]MCG2782380.1 iron chelate uptake ABC transporter family permease subunit [Candidatus Altiarchaeales archaeon]